MDPKKISVQMMELTHNKEILTYLIIKNSSEAELKEIGDFTRQWD
tara:strand:+ start:2216 stop:2350 length:135 start_codon:yes stop_codon:yes gene_type:complete